MLLSTADNKETNPIYKTWMSSLEQLLYFYKKSKLVATTTVLIKVNGVFGPWKETVTSSIHCWYIDTIARLVLYISNSDVSSFFVSDLTGKCQRDVKSGVTATNMWIDDYKLNLMKQKRNVIAGGVLVVKSKARWRIIAKSNDPSYFYKFIVTAMNHNVDIVIIHNCYSDNSVSKYKSACPSCHFVRHLPVNERIAHDQRFYTIYDYLLNNPDIGNLVTGDIRDVAFDDDPFKVMAKVGDHFYTGYDIPFTHQVGKCRWVAQMIKKCYPVLKIQEEVFNLYGLFNSGILGGSRHVMLALFSRILLYLDTASLNAVCDMATANVVLHLDYYDRVYSGYPFSASYCVGVFAQQGAAVSHKSGEVFIPAPQRE